MGQYLSIRPEIGRSVTGHIGPGAYEIAPTVQIPLGSMTRSERRCITTTSNVNFWLTEPGPGDYEIPTTIGRIPKYYKKLQKKLDESGCTTKIKYDPKATKMIKFVNIVSAPE